MNSNIRKVLVCLGAAALALGVLSSCKKDDDTTEYYYLSGTLQVSVPEYVYPSTMLTVTPKGVSHPEGGRLGYYFTPSWTSVADTTKSAYASDLPDSSYTFQAPATDGTYTLKVNAYTADVYYGTTTTEYITVVNPGLNKSLSNTEIRSTNPSFVDSRDGKRYYYTYDITDLHWMRQNLAYEGAGKAYKECEVMTDVLGRYYTWEEAATACPDGWRLPTEAEWNAFSDQSRSGDLMVDATFLGTAMWTYSRDVKITNSTYFGAIPAGYAVVEDGASSFSGINDYAAFWVADEYNGFGVYKYINSNTAGVMTGYADKNSFMASVRCVR